MFFSLRIWSYLRDIKCVYFGIFLAKEWLPRCCSRLRTGYASRKPPDLLHTQSSSRKSRYATNERKCGRNTLLSPSTGSPTVTQGGKADLFQYTEKMSPAFTHSITVADMYSSHLIRPSTMSDRRITNPSKAPPAPQHRTLPLSLRGINRDAGRRYIWVRNEDR